MVTWTLIPENREERLATFQLNYAQVIPVVPPIPLSTRVQSAVKFPFECACAFTTAVAQASFDTTRHAATSFRKILFGYSSLGVQPPLSLYGVCLRIFYWGLGLGANIFHTTLNRFGAKMQLANSALLQAKLGTELDIHHFRTGDAQIEVSESASTTPVRELLSAFDRIEFEDANHPWYMPPASHDRITKAQLRANLEKLIAHVEGRVAFLGTPPAYDIEGVERFYTQIENVIRFCLHKTRTELETFEADPQGKDHQEINNNWKNLRENRAQLAIRFAIAGGHCGARYMGEATDLYFCWKGERKTLNLQGELVEVLANKRLEIARAEAQRISTDTHAFAQYMAQMGSILAIPGTAQVTEYLAGAVNTKQLLTSFLQRYTVDTILEAVQARYKKSEEFREKVREWLADQMGEWESVQARINTLIPQVSAATTVNEILRLVPELQSQKETAERLLENKNLVEEALKSTLERERRGTFLQELLIPEATSENPLPPKILEWLLVKHQILRPQALPSSTLPPLAHQAELTQSITLLADASSPRNRRYQLVSATDPEAQRIADVFNRAFTKDPEKVIQLCEKAAHTRFYPLWKKIGYIHLPNAVDYLLTSRIVRWSTAAFLGFSLLAIEDYYALDVIPTFLLERVVPLIEATVPSQVWEICNIAFECLAWPFNNPLECFLGLCLLKTALRYSPHIPYLTDALSHISIKGIFFSLFNNVDSMRMGDFINLIFSVTDRCINMMNPTHYTFFSSAPQQRLIECRVQALQVWMAANQSR